MALPTLIPPNGGTLVNRIADAEQASQLRTEAAQLPIITLSAKQACDLEMIAIGAFSPLVGFVDQAEFESICTQMHTTDGHIWPIPITLAVSNDCRSKLKDGGRAALACVFALALDAVDHALHQSGGGDQ